MKGDTLRKSDEEEREREGDVYSIGNVSCGSEEVGGLI